MYEFGQDNADTTAVQKEVTPRKPKKAYENDFNNLNKDNVLGAALGPKMYSPTSTSEIAKKRLRKILSEGGYKFGEPDTEKKQKYKFGDMDERTGGLDYKAVMSGAEAK